MAVPFGIVWDRKHEKNTSQGELKILITNSTKKSLIDKKIFGASQLFSVAKKISSEFNYM